MVEPHAYQMRPSGREDDTAQGGEPTLAEQLFWQARLISAIERSIEKDEAQAREYEAEYAALVRQYVDGYRESAARKRARLADAEAGMLALIQQLPDKARRYKHGRVTFGVTPARESVEIVDEDAALTEIKSLGEAKAEPLIKVSESIRKKELAEFIKMGDAPHFEHIKLRLGSDSLRRTYPR